MDSKWGERVRKTDTPSSGMALGKTQCLHIPPCSAPRQISPYESLFPLKELGLANICVPKTQDQPTIRGEESRATAGLHPASPISSLFSAAHSAEAWQSAFLFFTQDTSIRLTCTCFLKEAPSYSSTPISRFSSLLVFHKIFTESWWGICFFFTSCSGTHQPNRCSRTFWEPHWFVFPLGFNLTEVSINLS